MFGIVAIVLCSIVAAKHHNAYGVVSGVIFGTTLLILYTMSSIYHGLNPKLNAKKVFQVIDHCSIFLLIAGSYTPFTLCTLRQYNTALRLVNFWNCMGNCTFRNYLKCYRLKTIQKIFNDMLFNYGLVHYFKNKCYYRIFRNFTDFYCF